LLVTLCPRLTSRQSTELTAAIKKYHPGSDIYAAALYTLAKAVFLQAEQEVTAKLDTAAPLSRVCVNLLTLPGFAEVLWARLVARSGGWIIGKYVEKQPGQDDKQFQKLNGILNEDETQLDRQTRITGLIQLHFAICIANTATPLPMQFRPQRIWLLFARILGDKRLMRQTMSLAVRVTFIPAMPILTLLLFRPCMRPWKWSQCPP
jgi:nucleoporin GLE1